jgi:hypothetical protein
LNASLVSIKAVEPKVEEKEEQEVYDDTDRGCDDEEEGEEGEEEQEEEDEEEPQEEETPDKVKPPLLVHCHHCNKKLDSTLFSINRKTSRYFSSCDKCRESVSDKNYEKNKPAREKLELERLQKEELTKKQFEDILASTDRTNCSNCKIPKLPNDFGINLFTHELYRMCTLCRDLMNNVTPEKIQEREQTVEDGVTFKCSVKNCSKISPLEYDEMNRCNFRRCKECRTKDAEYASSRQNDLRMFLEEHDLDEEIQCSNKKCTNTFKIELTAHGDTYYKLCPGHRSSRAKDAKNYDVNREKKLKQKKEYYAENKEAIRAKQKEYYDANSATIIAVKKERSEE